MHRRHHPGLRRPVGRRRVATHWATAARLARAYPAVDVDPKPLYIKDGNSYTAAGVTSTLDVSLALIAEDHGSALARSVARSLVTYLQRPASQAQTSMFVAPAASENDLVHGVIDFIAGHLTDDLAPPNLAARAGLSTRHLTRLFNAQVGMTPARYVRVARTEAARLRSTARRLGRPPSLYRRPHLVLPARHPRLEGHRPDVPGHWPFRLTPGR
ncbi:GlxA family transcriptional regulator [Frankia sp. QA3]|uniref:GlxA family transcriptional regulator n=1 Tax=Frankia sp. QA3 TaxID=710111 RepID=UPI0002F0E833|nr:helix-turn-helix domain-containing protein [Frankia sp. QA3]